MTLKLKELYTLLYPDDFETISLFDDCEHELCQGKWDGLCVGFGDFEIKFPISVYSSGGITGAEIALCPLAVMTEKKEA